jgi:hypothetical protein
MSENKTLEERAEENLKKIAKNLENMNIDESLIKEVEELAKDLEAQPVAEKLTVGSAIHVTDVSEMADKYLSDGAKEDLKRKSATLTVKYDDGQFFRSVYFSIQTRPEEVEKGVEIIANTINRLSQEGLIHSCLAPMSILKLARMPKQAPTVAVFCFVLVPHIQVDYIAETHKHVYTLEGGIGNHFGDIRPILSDGEFLAGIYVSYWNTAILGGDTTKHTDAMLQEQIADYLSILPKGTVVKEIVPCAVMDLSYPFEVKFYNPLLKRVKSVDLNWVRQVSVDPNDPNKVIQFNLLLGINYYGEDGKNLFVYENSL